MLRVKGFFNQGSLQTHPSTHGATAGGWEDSFPHHYCDGVVVM